ncbi:MAG: methyltransferase domain-containing protein [Chloroflexales bacterium]
MTWYPIEIRHTPTEEAEQRAYDGLYLKDRLRQRDSHYLWFLDQVRRYAPPPARLLDVSCGEGDFLRFASRSGYAAMGIDFSLAALQKLDRRSGTNVSAVAANAQGLPFADASFDVVTNIGSLEHYFDPIEGVREMARVLRRGGTAVVLLPNAYGIFGNVLHVLRHGEVFDDGQPLQRYATRGSWQRLLANHGLHTRHVLVLERPVPRTRHDLYWMLRRPQMFVRAFLGGLVPPNLGDLLVFVCSRDA